MSGYNEDQMSQKFSARSAPRSSNHYTPLLTCGNSSRPPYASCRRVAKDVANEGLRCLVTAVRGGCLIARRRPALPAVGCVGPAGCPSRASRST